MTDHLSDSFLIAKATDTVRLSEKYSTVRHTDFLSPNEAAVIKGNSIRGTDTIQEFFGGYEDAERVMFVSYPDYLEDNIERDFISLLVISGRDISELNHRDYLGSLLSLGIKREKIGDILVSDEETYIFVCSDISDYIIRNLTKIKKCGVKILKKSFDAVVVPEKKTEKICATVQSLRFDAVLTAALKTSRGKAVQYIESEKASINWKTVTEVSKTVCEGDVFSVRGYGRYCLESVGGTTKKGRTGITILKYI